MQETIKEVFKKEKDTDFKSTRTEIKIERPSADNLTPYITNLMKGKKPQFNPEHIPNEFKIKPDVSQMDKTPDVEELTAKKTIKTPDMSKTPDLKELEQTPEVNKMEQTPDDN